MSNRRRRTSPPQVTFTSGPGANPPTYWNGEPALAERVQVRVADTGAFPQYWARHLVGQVRNAVRVTYGGRTFYLDNEDGYGWRKVTHGGGPNLSSRSPEISEVIE